MKDLPQKITTQALAENLHGYKGWNTYALRDAKTNVHLATVGAVDRFYQDEYGAITRDLAHRYNNFLQMKEALVNAESALFYAKVEGEFDTPATTAQVNAALETVRDALRAIVHNYPPKA